MMKITAVLLCQHHKHWDKIVSYHPYPEASWRKTKNSVFNLNDDYYRKDGGIFEESEHYNDMFP